MNENITKALQTAQFLDEELRQIYRDAINKNDALLILARQLCDKSSEIVAVLAQLENVD